MNLIVNGTTRAYAQTHEICHDILKHIEGEYLRLDKFKEIPDDYLKGSKIIDSYHLDQYKNFIFVVPSYYVLPSPVFCNFINQMSPEQIKSIFSEKRIILVSVQDGPNLNEIHIDTMRRYFNKIFSFHKVDARVCMDSCMVNRSLDSRKRLIEVLNEFIKPCLH